METEHILSYSYGKDSGAAICVALEVLGWPIDRIVTADIWATDTIPADLPPMVEFKAKADEIILRRWGIKVEHFCAMDKNGEKQTYEKIFYHVPERKCPVLSVPPGSRPEIYGFPFTIVGGWCKRLKVDALPKTFPVAPMHKGRRKILCSTSA